MFLSIFFLFNLFTGLILRTVQTQVNLTSYLLRIILRVNKMAVILFQIQTNSSSLGWWPNFFELVRLLPYIGICGKHYGIHGFTTKLISCCFIGIFSCFGPDFSGQMWCSQKKEESASKIERVLNRTLFSKCKAYEKCNIFPEHSFSK